MESTGSVENSRITKAPKVTQACVRCRQKKNKCDGKTPSCSSCTLRGEECVYQEYQRRRGPGRSKQHMRALEKRLLDLETLLKQHRATPQSETGMSSSPSGHGNASAAGAEPAPHSDWPPVLSEEALPLDGPTNGNAGTLPGQVKSLDIREAAYRRMPLFRMVTQNMATDFDSPAVRQSLGRVPGQHIPIRKTEAVLAQNTVQEICDDLPVFEVPSFIEWIQRPETLEQRDKPSQWVCLNAIVALSMLMKTLNRSYLKIALFPWAYLKNAYAALPEVMLREANIWGVQAVLIMAMFMLRASGDTRAAAMFLSVAVRMIQTSGPEAPGGDVDSETRSRVFWAAYILDVEITLNCGIPRLLHDEDVGVLLPQSNTACHHQPDSLGTTVFTLRAELAIIQSRVRTRLYSASAFRMSDVEVFQAVTELASELDAWRSNIPMDIQPGRHGQMSDAALATPVIMLHLVFYNCVSMVHWAVRRHSEWGTGGATAPHRERMAASCIRVKTATKVVVQLLPRIKSKSITDVWRMLPYLLAPGLAFLAFILRDPAKVQARLNLKMLETLVSFIETLVEEEGMGFHSVLKGCTAIRGVAKGVVDANQNPNVAAGSPSHRHITMLIERMAHPMLVVQALLSNVPNRDTDVARSLSAALSMTWETESPFSPWVPAGQRPDTYGFKYDLT